MAAEVKILVEGFTNADSVAETGEERTQPTITLVRDGDLVMVVDPGILRDRQILIDALAKENLSVDDVNVVFLTHSHADHYVNAGMFPKAKILEYFGLWNENTVNNWPENFSPNLRILHTPGHDYTGLTLFVDTEEGVVAICGDVFWKKNHPENPHDDAYASNPERLRDSREMILETADWIIPGHGPMYKNEKSETPDGYEVKAEQKKEQPKISVQCKRCGRQMRQKDKCQCRPWLCFMCCECELDCDACSCSHRARTF